MVGPIRRHPIVPALQRQPQRGAERQPLREPDVFDRAHHADVHVGVDDLDGVRRDDDVAVDHEVQACARDRSVQRADDGLPDPVLAR